jgi:hypothetical protein
MTIHQLSIRISLRDWLSFADPFLCASSVVVEVVVATSWRWLRFSYARGARRPVTAGSLMHDRRHFASRLPPTSIASKIETRSAPDNYVSVTFSRSQHGALGCINARLFRYAINRLSLPRPRSRPLTGSR